MRSGMKCLAENVPANPANLLTICQRLALASVFEPDAAVCERFFIQTETGAEIYVEYLMVDMSSAWTIGPTFFPSGEIITDQHSVETFDAAVRNLHAAMRATNLRRWAVAS